MEVEQRQSQEIEAILREHPELDKWVNNYKVEVTYVVSSQLEVSGAVVRIDPQEEWAILEIFLQDLAAEAIPEPLSDIVLAIRDQSRKPGTWYWTEKQFAQADRHPDWIVDLDNMEGSPSPRGLRKRDIIFLGYELGKSQVEIKLQLIREGFSSTWTEDRENGRRVVGFEDPEYEDESLYQEITAAKRTLTNLEGEHSYRQTTAAKRTDTSPRLPKFSGNKGQRVRKKRR